MQIIRLCFAQSYYMRSNINRHAVQVKCTDGKKKFKKYLVEWITSCIFTHHKTIKQMKKFKDGSILYEPYERLTYWERIKEVLYLIVILPKIIFHTLKLK